MIYINSESTIVKFPQTSQLAADRIRFINQTTKQSFEVEVSDYSGFSNVYAFNIQEVIRFFETGQYDYLIFSGSEIIDRGIVQFGSFEHKTSQYNAPVNIIQYDVDGGYTPIPERVKNVTENGVYDVDGVDKVKVEVKLTLPTGTTFPGVEWVEVPDFVKDYISDGAECTHMFSNSKLENVDIDLRNVRHAGYMFENCTSLSSVNLGDMSSLTYVYHMFAGCVNLTELRVDKLPDVSLASWYILDADLSVESLMSIINALPVSTHDYVVSLGSHNKEKLSDDQIAIATNKGWRVS